MFIRKVTKKNKGSNKAYHYYRLTHSYKIGGKSRQQVLLNLGRLDDIPAEKHKLLADRIEQLITGVKQIFQDIDDEIEPVAQKYAKELIKKGVFPTKKNKQALGTDALKFTEVDLESTEELESRELGGEWLCKQAFDAIGLDTVLANVGITGTDAAMTKSLLTAKMIHPSSELETERWLKESSSAMELYDEASQDATRYRLYKAAKMLYSEKDKIEKELYGIFSGLFSNRNKIIIIDLTNTYFEGMMQKSQRAKFGRSKEKRSDCRLVSLSLAIDNLGFVRHSEFWDGNVSEPETLNEILQETDTCFAGTGHKPVLVFDAGIATEKNLEAIKGRYDYVCVSRSIPKEFQRLAAQATILEDKRGNEIKVSKVQDNNGDTLLHVESEQKGRKEQAMDRKLTERFEERLTYLKQGLGMPRRLKKTIPVHEHVGRLKDQFASVSKLYDIQYVHDASNETVTDITWIRKKEKEKPKGHYFLRYSKKSLTEKEIWDVYNLTREVEASFRCLKNDLNIRPVFHQKDQYIEPHIWLGIIAYQIVTYIRTGLKEKGIKHSWTTIVEKMKTQRLSLNCIDTKENSKAYIKLCTRPNIDAKEIIEALNFKDRPFIRQTKVVTQL